MFHSAYLYPPQHYPNLAALAETRAAEAAAKAQEAKYLAYQAALQEESSHLSHSPSSFWLQSPSAHCAGLGPAQSCSCAYPPQPPAFGAYPQPLFCLPAASPLGRPPFSHHLDSRSHGYHRQAHHGVPAACPQPSSLEIELKTKLKEEIIARQRAEQALRRKEHELAIRQRQLAALADSKPTRSGGSSSYWPFLGHQASFHHPISQQKPQPAPPKGPASGTKRTDDADSIQKLLFASLFGESAPSKGQTSESTLPKKANEALRPDPSPRTQKPSHAGSLIEQLKARYTREDEDEIQDTIQAIINSLYEVESPKRRDINAAAGTSRSAVDSRSNLPPAESIRATINILSSKPSEGPVSQATAAASPSTKGKEKDLSSSDTTPVDLKAALERVESITTTFHDLEAEFDLPSQLDFIVTPKHQVGGDVPSVFPHLAFTSRNHPVRYYEQTLATLLNQLDLIESHGDATLRRRRKDAVGSIEKALDDLEREVTALWKAKVAEEQSVAKAQESITTTASSSDEDTPAVQTPEPDDDAEAERESTELESNGSIVDQQDGASKSEVLPSSVEEAIDRDGESSPNSILEEVVSAEEDHVSATLGGDDMLVRPEGAEEHYEAASGHEVLDGSAESPLEGTGAPTFDETPFLENSHPLPEPSVDSDDNDDSSADETSAEDAFLLALPLESPKVKPSQTAHRQRVSAEEDLGSDWSELGA